MPIKHLVRLERFFPSRKAGNGGSGKKRGWKNIAVWILAIGLSAALVGALALTVAFAWYSRDLPDPNTLLARDVAQSTKIFDRTGTTLLYEIHGDEKRTLVKIEDLPNYVKQASVAIEDKRFYSHHGIDWMGWIRAVIRGILPGQRIQGTSTLTQQFVKNAILTNERSFSRKLKEVILALQIERLYTKDQILQMYLNEIPYGSTMYGVESAARGYFGKPAKDLTLDEAALLAALPQAPDRYSPYGTGSRGDNRKTLVGRQQYILDQMAEQGYVTKSEAEDAKKIDTLKKLVPKRIGDIRAPHFVTYVRSQLVEKYGQRVVEQGGLKVTTSLDWNLQQIAEDEVTKGVDARGEKYAFTNAALVALDPKNGNVLAMVGSKDFFDQEHDGQVNVVLRPRQPGSSFKPIVYAAGFLKGYTPEMTFWDVNTTFKTDLRDYQPKNYDLRERGPLSARAALQGSLNIPAVKMLYLVGVGRVLDFAGQLGYTTFGDRSRFGLSLVLGGGEVKLLEHAHAYAVFANEGKQAPIASILKVEDATGKVLEEWQPSDAPTILDREVALQISNVLSDNASRAYVFGLRNSLTLPDRQVAAKTGTTNDYHDAWTLGYTPSLVAGVWVGNMDNAAMKRGADGSIIAAPIWQAFMRRASASSTPENFPYPPPLNTSKPELLGTAFKKIVGVDKVSGKLATIFTPPELIEQRPVYEAHSELWYIDKDDPRGPAPSYPAADPQFAYWEAAVQDWVTRTQWNTTSTAPTDYDDIHTTSTQPTILIVSPTSNATVSSRDPQVTVSATAPRRIARFEAMVEGTLVGTSVGDVTSFTIHIPNTVGVGFHDLIVSVIDDVGNRSMATVTINLAAEPKAATATIISPANGTIVNATSFPATITILSSESANVTKVDLFLQEAITGDTRLLASEISPQSSELRVAWNELPPSGTYYLYAVLTTTDHATHPGPSITIKVNP